MPDMPAGPTLQIDDQLGARLAGVPLTGEWISPHSFKWKASSARLLAAPFADGLLEVQTDGTTGTMNFSSASFGNKSTLRVEKNRFVGGPGAMSIFSPKRCTRAKAGSIRLRPFPCVNRENFHPADPRVPREARPRESYPSWEHVCKPERYALVTKWLRRHAAHMQACLSYANKHGLDFIPDAAYADIAAKHRLPETLMLTNDDFFPHARNKRWIRKQDGSVHRFYDEDPPLIPGAVRPARAKEENELNTPWSDQWLFQQMEEGWLTPGVRSEHIMIFLRCYSKRGYQMIKVWDASLRKGSDPEAFCNNFTPQTLHLPSAPFIAAMRSAIEKPDRVPVAFRIIVDLSRDAEINDKVVEESMNARLRSARENAPPPPNLEMGRGADLGGTIAIFLDWDIEVDFISVDAEAYFDNHALGALRSTEAGSLGVLGAGLATAFSMGVEDAPASTGRFSSFFAEAVCKATHEALLELGALDKCPKLRRMYAARCARFGKRSLQARLVFAFMYSDDLGLVLPKSYREVALAIVMEKADHMGLHFTPEKYGFNIFIGYAFALDKAETSGMTIKPVKQSKYIECFRQAANSTWLSDHEADILGGRLNYASTIHLECKPVAALFNDCRYATHRMESGFPLSANARKAAAIAADTLLRNKSLPLCPDTDIPKHDDPSVITIRGDASLGEECGFNGWGCWILIPSKHGKRPTILGLHGEWTAEEQAALGHDTPSAEALTCILGSRGFRAACVPEEHHEKLLGVTDSESSSMKFASLRAGAPRLDNIREHWFDLHSGPGALPATLVHVPREFNVAADILSKKHGWPLFVATIEAAGLGTPIQIHLSPEDRDISMLLGKKRWAAKPPPS